MPHGILAKEGRSAADWELYRLHPYYTQRVLDRVAPLQALSEDAAAHHEWANGQGYHRQLRREHITLNGRILAVGNVYAGGSRQHGGLVDPEEVLSRMRPAVGTQFDAACYERLVASLNGTVRVAKTSARCRGTDELTEREVEVLGLLTQGPSNPQIARTLTVSRKTVEHHLEHIYGKLGVTCRTAALAYALQQRLS